MFCLTIFFYITNFLCNYNFFNTFQSNFACHIYCIMYVAFNANKKNIIIIIIYDTNDL